MYFLRISEQTEIISLYSGNWQVLANDMECYLVFITPTNLLY